ENQESQLIQVKKRTKKVNNNYAEQWQVKPGSIYDGDTLRVARGTEELFLHPTFHSHTNEIHPKSPKTLILC
ncbi:MAG: hypothetical protein WBM44_00405, partial [Waterburya sp.]